MLRPATRTSFGCGNGRLCRSDGGRTERIWTSDLADGAGEVVAAPAVMNKELEIKKDLDDAEMSRVMTTMIKQRRESVELFEKGNRAELAAKERQEITILESYLPQALSPEQLSAVVDAAIQETGVNLVGQHLLQTMYHQ